MFQGIMILEISSTDLSQLKNMKSYMLCLTRNPLLTQRPFK